MTAVLYQLIDLITYRRIGTTLNRLRVVSTLKSFRYAMAINRPAQSQEWVGL